MIYLKQSVGLALIIIFLFIGGRTYGQQIDEKTYQHKMRLIDSLSFYKVQEYDTLYHASVVTKSYGRDFNTDYYGWISQRNPDEIHFLNKNGTELDLAKSELTEFDALPINNATIDVFVKEQRDFSFFRFDFGKNYLLSLWLYKKGKIEYSKKLLPANGRFFSDEYITDDFGIIYYDAMLSAFSRGRDYNKAITFGKHLSNDIFNAYQYQKQAIALTGQLKNSKKDFKEFRIPDSLEWTALKQKIDRKQQISYLADRLKLLNCVQDGQPGGIGFRMYQFSIPFTEAQKLGISYWAFNKKYGVINPYTELLAMNLNLEEIKLLLPYLLSDAYIPSYSYFRDFRPERTLYKLSWVVQNLIYDATDELFFERKYFDSLAYDQKQIAVNKIKEWCDNNASLSKEERTIKILKTTDKWKVFEKALKRAKLARYNSLLPVIVQRYNDFKDMHWPVHKYAISRTMYELGNESYIGTVRQWSKDTTEIEVNLWTSMFLLKYDKNGYEQALISLKSVLSQCDGIAYYPHAIDLLLSLKDERAFKIAERILDKSGFQQQIYWDYYINIVKKLLLRKSDYAFTFLIKKLNEITPDERQLAASNNVQANALLPNDVYVLAVDKLKNASPGYDAEATPESRFDYRKALGKWLNVQYDLFKNGKPNELHLEISNEDEPFHFVDAPD